MHEAATTSHVFSRAPGRALPVVARAVGSEIWDTDGKRYLDGSGGAVVVNVGHGREEVADAIARQALTAAYVHGTQFTSDALEEYARRLAPHAPPGCDRLYLVSGGSEANETAVKIARAYQRARGQASRHKIIRRSVSYHGNTLFTLVAVGPAVAARALRAAARADALGGRAVLLPLPARADLPGLRGRLRRRAGGGHPPRGPGDGGRVRGRADPGRVRRRGGAARGLRAPRGGHLPAPRRRLHRRRGDDGLRPHRRLVRVRVERNPSRTSSPAARA